LLRHHALDHLLHRATGAVEHFLLGAVENVVTEALGQFHAAFAGSPAGGDDGVEVRAVPARQAHVVQDDVKHVAVHNALAVQLDRRDADAFLPDRGSIGRQRAGHLAADVGHVAKHGRIVDDAAVLEDRHQHQPIRQVAHRAIAQVGVVGEEDVAFLDLAGIALQEAGDERAELADDHLAFVGGDQREGIALLADARAHGGAAQYGVHLVTGIAQRVLDDVDGDAVHRYAFERGVIGLGDTRNHDAYSCGRISRLPTRSTAAS